MTVHFSVLGNKSLCGTEPSKRGEFTFTADLAALTCARCKTRVQSESATGAELWTLVAEEKRERAFANAKGITDVLPTSQHLQQLYVIAIQKREADLQRCREKLEYAQEQFTKLVERATSIGVTADTAGIIKVESITRGS